MNRYQHPAMNVTFMYSKNVLIKGIREALEVGSMGPLCENCWGVPQGGRGTRQHPRVTQSTLAELLVKIRRGV